jgi:hypothetical protein
VLRLFALVLSLIASVPAHAGYALANAPVGWSGSSGAWRYAAPANSPWIGGAASANVTMNVGGRVVSVPAAMRLSANAGQFVARGLLTAGPVGATAAAIAWCALAAIAWDAAEGRWEKSQTTSGFVYRQAGTGSTYSSPQALANDWLAYWNSTGSAGSGYYSIGSVSETQWVRNNHNSAGTVINTTPYAIEKISGSVTETVPATQADMDALAAAHPMPMAVPNEAPYPSPMPVELPAINPDPAPSLAPQPFPVPIGSPAAVPGTNPQEYSQPYIQVEPAPTEADPWRIEYSDPQVWTGTDPAGVETPAPVGAQSDIVTCGLPATPPCKIDETGTPPEQQKEVETDIESRMQEAKDIAQGDVSRFDPFPAISWTFALPTGCGVIAIPAFAPFLSEINICPFQEMFHSIMSMVWVIGGLFGAISIFWRDQLQATG